MNKKTFIPAALLALALGMVGCDPITNVATENDTPRSPALHSSSALAGNTLIVTPNDTNWYFSSDHYNEEGDLVTGTSGTGGIAEAPAVGNWGAYGFKLSIPAGQKARAMTDLYNGYTLAELEEVAYSTYIESAWTSGYGPSINVMIDPADDVNGTPDDFVTLVWEANKASHTILEDTWQTWSTAGGSGGWWSPSINFNATTPGSNRNPAQLEALADYFGAESEIIGFAVNVGRHGAMTSYVDGVGITVSGVTTTYDFEPFQVATSKDECKGGEWQNLRRTDGSPFHNQGDCIQYVNTSR